jgi:hypothetical protein
LTSKIYSLYYPNQKKGTRHCQHGLPVFIVTKVDGFVKSLKTTLSVIPAKAGIQYFQGFLDACLRKACPCVGRGMTGFLAFCRTIKVERFIFFETIKSVVVKGVPYVF